MNGVLKQRWYNLPAEEKAVWKKWEVWDKLRFEHDCLVYESKSGEKGASMDVNPNEPKQEEPLSSAKANGNGKKSPDSTFHIPKKKKKHLPS